MNSEVHLLLPGLKVCTPTAWLTFVSCSGRDDSMIVVKIAFSEFFSGEGVGFVSCSKLGIIDVPTSAWQA